MWPALLALAWAQCTSHASCGTGEFCGIGETIYGTDAFLGRPVVGPAPSGITPPNQCLTCNRCDSEVLPPHVLAPLGGTCPDCPTPPPPTKKKHDPNDAFKMLYPSLDDYSDEKQKRQEAGDENKKSSVPSPGLDFGGSGDSSTSFSRSAEPSPSPMDTYEPGVPSMGLFPDPPARAEPPATPVPFSPGVGDTGMYDPPAPALQPDRTDGGETEDRSRSSNSFSRSAEPSPSPMDTYEPGVPLSGLFPDPPPRAEPASTPVPFSPGVGDTGMYDPQPVPDVAPAPAPQAYKPGIGDTGFLSPVTTTTAAPSVKYKVGVADVLNIAEQSTAAVPQEASTRPPPGVGGDMYTVDSTDWIGDATFVPEESTRPPPGVGGDFFAPDTTAFTPTSPPEPQEVPPPVVPASFPTDSFELPVVTELRGTSCRGHTDCGNDDFCGYAFGRFDGDEAPAPECLACANCLDIGAPQALSAVDEKCPPCMEVGEIADLVNDPGPQPPSAIIAIPSDSNAMSSDSSTMAQTGRENGTSTQSIRPTDSQPAQDTNRMSDQSVQQPAAKMSDHVSVTVHVTLESPVKATQPGEPVEPVRITAASQAPSAPPPKLEPVHVTSAVDAPSAPPPKFEPGVKRVQPHEMNVVKAKPSSSHRKPHAKTVRPEEMNAASASAERHAMEVQNAAAIENLRETGAAVGQIESENASEAERAVDDAIIHFADTPDTPTTVPELTAEEMVAEMEAAMQQESKLEDGVVEAPDESNTPEPPIASSDIATGAPVDSAEDLFAEAEAPAPADTADATEEIDAAEIAGAEVNVDPVDAAAYEEGKQDTNSEGESVASDVSPFDDPYATPKETVATSSFNHPVVLQRMPVPAEAPSPSVASAGASIAPINAEPAYRTEDLDLEPVADFFALTRDVRRV